jgi:RimJ/RimL family protein N-acetyltransferase
MLGMAVVLRPFTAELLEVVQPWFHHPEVQRWLGGPEWPARALSLAGTGLGESFRGRLVLRDHTWVAFDDSGAAVAYIGGDIYDRWSRYSEGPDGPIVGEPEAGPAMGFAYVVDPRRWRQGFGAATVRAVMDAPEVSDVVLFAAGIEPDNIASARCLTAAGLLREPGAPDWEGIVHYIRRRGPNRSASQAS